MKFLEGQDSINAKRFLRSAAREKRLLTVSVDSCIEVEKKEVY